MASVEDFADGWREWSSESLEGIEGIKSERVRCREAVGVGLNRTFLTFVGLNFKAPVLVCCSSLPELKRNISLAVSHEKGKERAFSDSVVVNSIHYSMQFPSESLMYNGRVRSMHAIAGETLGYPNPDLDVTRFGERPPNNPIAAFTFMTCTSQSPLPSRSDYPVVLHRPS